MIARVFVFDVYRVIVSV